MTAPASDAQNHAPSVRAEDAGFANQTAEEAEGLRAAEEPAEAAFSRERGYRAPILVSLIATMVILLFFLDLRRGGHPPTMWIYWLALPFIVVPGILSRNAKAAGFGIGLFAFIQISGFFLSAPYGIPYYRDPLFNMQLASLITDAHAWDAGMGIQLATAYSYYPGSNLYHAGFAIATGLSLPTTYVYALPLLRFAVLPMAFFRLLRRFLTPLPSYFAVTAFLSSPSNLFNLPLQQEFAYVFAILAIYAGLLAPVPQGRFRLSPPALVVSVLFLSTVSVSHYFTAYVFGAAVSALALVWAVGGWRRRRSTKARTSGWMSHPLAGMAFVAPVFLYIFFLWSTFVSSPIDLFWFEFAGTIAGSAIDAMFTPGGLGSVGAPSSGGVRAGFSYTTPELALVGGALVVIGIGALLGLWMLIRQTRQLPVGRRAAARSLVALFVVALLLLIGSAPLVFTQGLFIPLRIMEFAILGIAPLMGLFLAFQLRRRSIPRAALVFVMVSVLVVGGSMVQLSNPRFDYLLPQALFCNVPQHMTPDVVSAVNWAVAHLNRSARVFGDEIAFDAFAGLGHFGVLPEHLGYMVFNATSFGNYSLPLRDPVTGDLIRDPVTGGRLYNTTLRNGDIFVVDTYMYSSICFASYNTAPMDPSKLQKFATSPLVSTVFENKALSLYEWEGSR